MPPINVPPGHDADTGVERGAPRMEIDQNVVDTATDAPRLEIDDEGVARVVFLEQTYKSHFVIDKDEHGVAQTVFPNPNKEESRLDLIHPTMDGMHLRVGEHRDSYARTKLVEPRTPAEPAEGEHVEPPRSAAPDEGPTVHDDTTVEEESGTNIVLVAPIPARQIVDIEAEDAKEEMAVGGRAVVASGIVNTQEMAVGAANLQGPDFPPVVAPWKFAVLPPPLVHEHVEEQLAEMYPHLRGSDILWLLARNAAFRHPDLFQSVDALAEFPVTTVHENAEEATAEWAVVDLGPGALPLYIPWRPSALPSCLAHPGDVQPHFGQWEQGQHEQSLEEQSRQEAQAQSIENIPVLPPVVSMQMADARTRVRSGSTILTIKGEKYVKVDETHFLYAVNAEYLLGGDNATLRRHQCAEWSTHVPSLANERAPRPQILFELYPLGEFAYTAENGRRKQASREFRPQCDIYGRVLLNAYDRPLKFSYLIPYKVSTEIEGWEMEALCRLDSDLCTQDFIDRMLPDAVVGGKGRPTRGTLSNRRRQDRMRLRILPWPVPRDLSYSDQQLIKELGWRSIQHNTTLYLKDLTKDEMDMQEAIMYGGHFERSGAKHALHDQARLQRLWVNLRLVRTRFAENSDEVQLVKGRVVQLLQKMGRERDAAVVSGWVPR
ncbi:hypothetical protein A1O7_03515 [Cladophialophora yegresii CBS 114405]|uniref:Uncharacterized protein n=1 Tax=Cladophialophora yegresii CBS 114405 TaxID=1182544 RepID=W9WDJ3_9EURO|nr:uncharacterized protein A1O7_03515 [Cladophialophora yegresii CBS 114405]EXJ63070.1 hypothetical protein A1O7_03515 [Cladophialophora yegresii CBS 114405]